MCREETNDILSDDLSDCHEEQFNNQSSPTNWTLATSDNLTRPAEPEPRREKVTAVNVYRIYQQLNTTSTPPPVNISTSHQEINQTIQEIKRTNLAANITDTRELERREKRSAEVEVHIRREDDVDVLSLGQPQQDTQYHSILVVVGVLPLAVVVLCLVTLLVRAIRDNKKHHRDESGEAGLSQIVISQSRQQRRQEDDLSRDWQCVIRDENSPREAFSVPRKRSLEKKEAGRDNMKL